VALALQPLRERGERVTVVDLVTGPGTPYVTPAILNSAPTGISWSTIPFRNATADQQYAEQLNMCQRATSMVDTTCNHVLRSTINTESLDGPDYRLTIRSPSGVARAMMTRWPVTQIVSGRVSSSFSFPPSWTSVAANQFTPEVPPIGIYGTSSPSDAGEGGQGILVAPGIVTWARGRNGYRLEITYVNGWPHTSLTAVVLAGASTISVDDCTGWAPVTSGGQGATGVLKDGATQEAITCVSATALSGPGVLTLSRPLTYGHLEGVVCTTLPEQVQWAAILFCVSQALSRGATATTVQATPGMGQSSGGGVTDVEKRAVELCRPYRRVF
jgi:hypothetical protein